MSKEHYNNQKLEQLSDIMSQFEEIPNKVQNIQDCPYEDFSILKSDLESGQIILQRFGHMRPVYMDALGLPVEQAFMKFCACAMIFTPILFLALSIFVSWYLIFGALFYFFFLKQHKVTYDSMILREAFTSEKHFSFLFHCNQISITSADFQECWYKKRVA